MCEASDCVWLFLDASKNRSRRWCDMNQCGNREKARRFHERAKGER
jgi:predicted RNA-binding Zn ribbon-like protein